MTLEKGEKRAWEDAFIDALSKTGNVSKAAKSAKISRTIAYEHKKESAEFSQRWEEAMDTAVDSLEFEAWRRAAKGVRKPAGWYQGIPGGYVQEYSDTLLIFLLKAHRPEKFRENIDLTTAGQPLSFHIKLSNEDKAD